MKRITAVAAFLFFNSCRGTQEPAQHIAPAAPDYVDSAQCAACHAESPDLNIREPALEAIRKLR